MPQPPLPTELRVRTARGTHAMAVTGQAHATDAALAVLHEGGNAVDAAVCAALVLAVVCPYACTLAGDLFALVYEPGNEIVGLNATGAAPASAEASVFPEGVPQNGVRSATIPGMLRGLDDLHRRYGTLTWARLVAPALELAARGFPVHPTLAANTRERAELLARDPAAHALFLPGGEPLAEGTLFVQPDLAHVLRTIAADGADAFYAGALTDDLVRATASLGGLWQLPDLWEHASLWQAPLGATFCGHDVWTMPPNSYGATLLLQLRELEGAVAGIDPDSPAFVRAGFAARTNAYATAAPWIADPRIGEAPARAFFSGSDGFATAASPPESRSGGTTNAIVVDADGRAVSLIESISAPYGAGVVLGGTGILLNNRMAGFDDDPDAPNGVAPCKRPANTLSPALVTRGERLVMSLGTPGTVGQTCTLAQFLARALGSGETLEAAAAAPRWSVDFAGRLVVEHTMDATLRAQVLADVAHSRTMPSGWTSFGSIKLVAASGEGLLGLADYRRAATAAGW